ncbi:MAG: hypothetical protein DMG12_01520 [Acidobacteria bacterium]|nr:MAG: hypothetical protein DMG12_01520 [Acidobacteriota bacterium]
MGYVILSAAKNPGICGNKPNTEILRRLRLLRMTARKVSSAFENLTKGDYAVKFRDVPSFSTEGLNRWRFAELAWWAAV